MDGMDGWSVLGWRDGVCWDGWDGWMECVGMGGVYWEGCVGMDGMGGVCWDGWSVGLWRGHSAVSESVMS